MKKREEKTVTATGEMNSAHTGFWGQSLGLVSRCALGQAVPAVADQVANDKPVASGAWMFTQWWFMGMLKGLGCS